MTEAAATRCAQARALVAYELPQFQPSVWFATIVTRLLPSYSCLWSRSVLLRLAGWNVGEGASIFGRLNLYGRGDIRPRLSIGSHVMINVRCTIELNECVTIGDHAALGHEVLVLTSTHRLGRHGRRADDTQLLPVTIGAGSWVGSRSIILPGVTIGEGSVVMAGSVVNSDVAPDTVVAGIPATCIVPRLPR